MGLVQVWCYRKSNWFLIGLREKVKNRHFSRNHFSVWVIRAMCTLMFGHFNIFITSADFYLVFMLNLCFVLFAELYKVVWNFFLYLIHIWSNFPSLTASSYSAIENTFEVVFCSFLKPVRYASVRWYFCMSSLLTSPCILRL